MNLPGLSHLTPLTALTGLPNTDAASGAAGTPLNSGGAAFSSILNSVLANNANAEAKADKAVQALATGETDDLHSVSLAVVEADLNFRMLLEMRNRLTDAYQEVMRMQL